MTSVPSADEAIATFTEQPTPLAFLSVVQALSDGPDAKKRLTSLWEAHRAQVTPLTAHDVAEVLSWLSEIRPCGTFEMPRSGPANPQPEWLEDIFEAVKTVAPVLRQAQRRRKSVQERLFPHAGCFGAGYGSYPHFAEFFREHNPVDVIGEHTRLWFASDSAGHTEHTRVGRTLSSNGCAYLHAVWLPTLGRMIDGRRNSKALSQLALWLRSNQTLPLVVGRPEHFCVSRSRRPWQFDFQLIADTLPLFPQSYFERVLDPLSDYLAQSDSFDDEAQYDYVKRLCDVLLSLPIGPTSRHALSDLHEGALTALVKSYGLRTDNVPFVPMSQCQSLLWGCSCVSQHVFQVGSEREQAADAPPASDFYLCDRDEFHTLCSHISDACEQHLAANARIPNNWVGLAGECLAPLTHPDNLAAYPLPLPLSLATTRDQSDPGMPTYWTPYSWAHLTTNHFSRADAECGLQAANMAAKSHYWELANALFAFVVFRGLLDSKTALLCDWSQLMATYTRLTGTPGHDMAEKALTITADALQDLSPGSFHAFLLQQWSRSGTTHAPARGVKWGELTEILRDRLLKAVWPRLPHPVQSQIINAEALWTLQHQLLGTTDPPIGANLVVEYAKCIEVPLKERLKPVLDSPAFKEYQTRQGKGPHDRPTLGTMVHLLLDRQLPLPLQGEMRKLRMVGIDIAALQSIAPELKTIPHERNDGAHAHVTGAAAMKFRERLYGGGVFARFFSALYPA